MLDNINNEVSINESPGDDLNTKNDLIKLLDNFVYGEYILDSGQKYQIRTIDRSYLQDLVSLQSCVVAGLPEWQTFIYEKDVDTILSNCNYENWLTIWVILDDGTLIWQAVVLFEYDWNVPLPLDDRLIDFNYIWWTATSVDKNYRGNRVMTKMMNARDDAVRMIWKDGLWFPIDHKNIASYKPVLRSKYLLTNAYVDPVDWGKTYTFHKPLDTNIDFWTDEMLSDDFDQIIGEILPNGYVWCGIDENDDIVFRKILSVTRS